MTAAQLFVALVLAASPSERDLLLVLASGDSPAEAAERLGVTREALKVTLHRLRRRAAELDL